MTPALSRAVISRAAVSRAALDRFALAAAVLLALTGVGIAGYLSVLHYTHQTIVCGGLGDCNYVNSSEYAKLLGVPVATVGAIAYAAMAALSLGAWLRRDAMLLLSAWAVALASFGFSMYLTYIELRVLYAICVWCVASASVATALFVALSLAVYAWRDEILGAAPVAEIAASD